MGFETQREAIGRGLEKRLCDEPDHRCIIKERVCNFFYTNRFDELNSFAMLFYGLSDKLKSHSVYSTFSLAR